MTTFKDAIDALIADRDEYRDQADNYAMVIAGHETRIAALENIVAAAATLHEAQRKDLAAMPRTPDGTLVVLGETELWRLRHDGAMLHGVIVGIDIADKTVHAKWFCGANFAYEQTVAMRHCRGTEAAIIEASKP